MTKTYKPNIDHQKDQENFMDQNTDVADYQCIDVKEEDDTNSVTLPEVESEENGENNLLIYGYIILAFGVAMIIILLMLCAHTHNSIVKFTDEDGDTQILTFHHDSKKWDLHQVPSLQHKLEGKGVEDFSGGKAHVHYEEIFHENFTLEYEASIGFLWYTIHDKPKEDPTHEQMFYITVAKSERDQVMKTIQTLDPKKHSFISTDKKEVTLTFDKNEIIWNAYIDGNPIEMKPMSNAFAKETLKMPEELLYVTKLRGFLIAVEEAAVREKYSWFRKCNYNNQDVYLKVGEKRISAKADSNFVLKTTECKFPNDGYSTYKSATVKFMNSYGADSVFNFTKFDKVQEVTIQDYVDALEKKVQALQANIPESTPKTNN